MILSLTGFMGCGKSTYGRQLSSRLGVPFIDLDDYIEKKDGRKIAEIFKNDGEKAFRKMELEALKEVIAKYEGENAVLSLGGGTLTTPECADIVKENTFCIYLKAGTDTLIENLRLTGLENRPVLQGNGDSGNTEDALRARIETLMAQREDAYKKTSRLVIDTDGKPGEVISREIIEYI